MKSVNKAIIIGNLGKDPVVKFTPNGTEVATISVATNSRFQSKDGEWNVRTEWHNIVLWQNLAKIAGKFLKKGSKVYIEGRLQTRSWDDKTSGQKRYTTEIVATDLSLLDTTPKTAVAQKAATQTQGKAPVAVIHDEFGSEDPMDSAIADEDISF